MTTSAKVRMVATARQNYAGRSLRIGDHFEVDNESDAADLETIRFATRLKTEIPPQYETRGLEATDVVETKPVDTGRYKRRDLRASK